MSTWWGTRSKVTPRMVFEVDAMRMLFSEKRPVLYRQNVSWDAHFFVVTHELNFNTDGALPYWEAKFQTINVPGSRSVINTREIFELQVLYSSNYPASEPQANLTNQNLSGAQHLFPGGKLCLHAHNSARDGWDPAKSTAATIALWAIQWTRAWLYWKKTNVWPEARR